MTTIELTPTQITSGAAVLLVLLWMWRAGRRRARHTADAARAGAQVLSLFGRVLFTAGLIVGAQWAVITHPGTNPWVLLAVLGAPALLASHAVTRALTVTTIDTPRTHRRWGRR
jgi:hypothetical protein